MSERPTIACIDDDPFVREALEGLLRSTGYQALVFSSAEDFLQSADRHRPSCIITDMKLGGMSGLDLLRRLMDDGQTVPAIVVTAFADESLRTQALAEGAIGFLPKPIHDGELLALLKRALDRPSP